MNRSNLFGKFFLVGAFALAGTSVVAARFVSGKLGVFTIAFLSMFFALLLLVPICWKQLRVECKAMTPSAYFSVLLQAVFGMFLFRVFLLNGVSRTSSLEAGILTGATPAIFARPPITAAIGRMVLRER